MGIYQLKFCKEEDKPLLLDFIKRYWQEDHVFVKSDELLRFQHYNPLKEEYSFILGVNTQTNQIDGIIGLIPVSQYDPALAKYNDTWGGIWKVRSDVRNEEIGSLGMRLFGAFNMFTSHGSIGMSKVATKLHAMMNYTSCSLNQYYILNPECSEFKIAVIPFKVQKIKSTLKSGFKIKKISNITDIPRDEVIGVYYPIKSLSYLQNRFSHHPIYQYKFWGIYSKNKSLKTIFVTRSIDIKNSRVIRIVDVLGPLENLGTLKAEFEALCKVESAEYIDIMNYGVSKKIFEELGFEQLNVNENIIIPTHFEPFVAENIVIKCAYRAPNEYVMFKADSDQDRPSIIN
jgi:hypothetical protein